MEGQPSMEEILCHLLVPDNAVIAQATALLSARAKLPNSFGCVPELLAVLTTSALPQARHTAAVLLRTRVVKQWGRLRDLQTHVKAALLHVLQNDPEPFIRRSIVPTVSVVARFELPSDRWPELLPLLHSNCLSENAFTRELGMLVLSSVAEAAAEQLRPQFQQLFQLFGAALQDAHLMVAINTMRALNGLMPTLDQQEVPLFRTLIDPMLAVVQRTVMENEAHAIEALDVFTGLIESELPIVAKHVPSLVHVSLALGGNQACQPQTRIKALTNVLWLIARRSKSLVKKGLLEPVLQTTFQIMLTETCADQPDEDSVGSFVPELLSALADNIPAELVFPHVAQYMQAALQAPLPTARKSAFIALFFVTPGTAHYIRQEGHLLPALQLVFQGLSDPERIVRQMACIALSGLSQECQPEICEHHDVVLRTLFEVLGDPEPEVQERACYALEAFLEHLGSRVVPYMEQVMDRLIFMTTLGDDIHQVAVGCMAVVARSAGQHFAPYFDQIMLHLQQLMTQRHPSRLMLLTQAADALGCLANCPVGEQGFAPHAEQVMALGLQAISEVDDPDVRTATMLMFGSVALALQGHFVSFLVPVATFVLGICGTASVAPKQHQPAEYAHLSHLENLDSDDDDGDEVTTRGVSGVLSDEQEAAFKALGCCAEATGPQFASFLQPALAVVDGALQNEKTMHPKVRKAVYTCLTQIMCCLSASSCAEPVPGTWTRGLPPQFPMEPSAQQILDRVLAGMLETVSKEEDITIVSHLLEHLNELLERVGPPILASDGMFDSFAFTIFAALQRELPSQQTDFIDDIYDHLEPEGDEDEEELLGRVQLALTEYAAEAVVLFAKIAGEAFTPYAKMFFRILGVYLHQRQPVNWRSVSVGTLAEVTEALGPLIEPVCDMVYESLVATLHDPECEVRSNAAFALGLLCHHCSVLRPAFPDVLKLLFATCIAGGPGMERAKDNACGAVARMILAHADVMPVWEVLPVMVQCLPLQEDLQEYLPVLGCFAMLLTHHADKMTSFLPAVLTGLQAALDSTLPDECPAEYRALMGAMQQVCPNELQAVVASLEPQKQAALATLP